MDERALAAYRRAQSALKAGESGNWLIGNIGNVYYNRGLYSDAIGHFEKALEENPKSQYSHDRLADAMTAKEASDKEYSKKCAEGLRIIRQRNSDRQKALESKETPPVFPSPYASLLDQMTKIPPLTTPEK